MFPISKVLKQEYTLSPLLFNFAVQYAIRRVKENKDGLKLNGTHQLWVCGDGVNILGASVRTIEKNTEAVVVANKETGLEVNTDKTKYIIRSRDQNAGRSHNIKTDNSSYEKVEEFKYFGRNLTDENAIQEEIKSRLNSGNSCYHSVSTFVCLPGCYLKTQRLRYTEL
jgi:hypothetical protein